MRGKDKRTLDICFLVFFFFSGKIDSVDKNSKTSVQFSSVAQSCMTLWPCELQHSRPTCPSPTAGVHPNPWVGDAVQPSHPLSSPSPPALNLSQCQGLFKWVSSSHQVAKLLGFQLQHQSSNEHPGLISFRMDWLDLLAVQGTLKSLLQYHKFELWFWRRLLRVFSK